MLKPPSPKSKASTLTLKSNSSAAASPTTFIFWAQSKQRIAYCVLDLRNRQYAIRNSFMTIKIVTDSTCDLPESAAAAHGITIIPAYINIGDRSYLDGVE